MNPRHILDSVETVALVGYSPNPERYANRIYQSLKQHNKHVYCVNPRYTEELGIYKTLNAIDARIDMVIMVIRPEIGITMIDDIQRLEIPRMWFQPGTRSAQLRIACHNKGIEYIEACVLEVYASTK